MRRVMYETEVGNDVFGPATIRAPTHRNVSMDDIETALAVIHRLFAKTIVP